MESWSGQLVGFQPHWMPWSRSNEKETHTMTYTYAPTGVCSSQIDLELEDGVIRSVAFTGGCNGNLQVSIR